ncbi:hypothetical protein Taro_034478 [Colocasia esculenta]|uniref:Uncharacterized protein n=1 Tax=Colocasia esculenta TaxID=4460 RepID=A0A843WFL7_COLES|nr:hypothetical protein [Colocasia esculenta]
MTVRQRTPATASPYLKRVGVPYQPEQHELQQAEAKLLHKAVKQETPTTEYYKVAEIKKHLNHNPGQAKHNSRKTKANPLHTPAETKKLTEHQSNHERPGFHDTSTNIPDLHEVVKEQPGVTTRDTEHLGEKSVSPQPRPPQTSTRLRAHKQNHPGPRTCHKVRELHRLIAPRTTPRNELPKQ